MCLLAICMSSQEKYLHRSSAHFLTVLLGFFLLSCMSCLYVWEVKPLLVTLFANVFLPIHSLIFLLVYGFLCCAKVFKFHQIFLCFCFYFLCLGRLTKKSLLQLCQNVLPRFPARSFMVSCLIFKSLKHFGFYFCIWYEGVFSLHRFTGGSPAVPTPLAKETVLFFHCIHLYFLSKIN